MITLLNRDNPEVLQKLADSKFNFRSTAGCIKQRKPHISREPKELTTSLEIDDGIFIETNLSAQSIMLFLKSLLQSLVLMSLLMMEVLKKNKILTSDARYD